MLHVSLEHSQYDTIRNLRDHRSMSTNGNSVQQYLKTEIVNDNTINLLNRDLPFAISEGGFATACTIWSKESTTPLLLYTWYIPFIHAGSICTGAAAMFLSTCDEPDFEKFRTKEYAHFEIIIQHFISLGSGSLSSIDELYRSYLLGSCQHHLYTRIPPNARLQRRLDPSTIQELLRDINRLRPQVFQTVLPQSVIRGASIIPTIQMVVEQEVHRLQMRHLEPIDRLADVLLGAEQFLDLVDRQQTPEPVPLVVVAHEEAVVAVQRLVAAAAEDDVAEGRAHRLAETREVDGILGLVGWLLVRVLLRPGRDAHIGDALVSEEEVHAMVDFGLGEERDPVLIVWLSLGLAHVVAQRCALRDTVSLGITMKAGIATHWDAFEECNHATPEKPVGVLHPEKVAIRALCEDTEVDGGNVLVPCIDWRRSVDMELQQGEFLDQLLPKRLADLGLCVLRLLFDIEADEVDVIFRLIAGRASDSMVVSLCTMQSKLHNYPILVVGGGGRPLTPLIETLSSPSRSILMPSNCATTSEL